MRVLVAIDLSPASEGLVQFAADLVRRLGGDLTAVHVYSTTDAASALEESGLPLDRFLERLHGAVTSLLRRAEAAVAQVHVVHGDPVEAILDRASHDQADLIVMGTHGRSGLSRLLVGSVAEGVLRRAACPVVVIPYTVLVGRAGVSAAGRETTMKEEEGER